MIEIYVMSYAGQVRDRQSARFGKNGGSIGRNRENALALEDPDRNLSRVHAYVQSDPDGRFSVHNISNSNSIFVNAKEVEPQQKHPLNDGDELRIGLYVLGVGYVDTPSAGGASHESDDVFGLPVAATAPLASIAGGDPLFDILHETRSVTPRATAVQTELIPNDFNIFDLPSAAARNIENPLQELAGKTDLQLGHFLESAPEATNLIGNKLSEVSLQETSFDAAQLDIGLVSPASVSTDPLLLFGGNGSSDVAGILASAPTGMAPHGAAMLHRSDDYNATHAPEIVGLFGLPEISRESSLSSQIQKDTNVSTASVVRPEPVPSSIMPVGEQGIALDPLANFGGADDTVASFLGISPETTVLPDSSLVIGSNAPPVVVADHVNTAIIASDDCESSAGRGHDAETTFRYSDSPTSAEGPVAAPAVSQISETDAASTSNNVMPVPQPVAAVAQDEPRVASKTVSDADSGKLPSASLARLAEALLEGAGVKEMPLDGELDEARMREIGRFLRACVDGVVDLTRARALTKREVRADVTIIVANGNNPLKFAPDGQAAMMQMLGKRFPGFMPPVEAMEDIFSDLRAHEIGVMNGSRAALAEILKRFDPEQMSQQVAEPRTADALFPNVRKAKLWSLYNETYAQVVADAETDYRSLYGEAFRRAYEDEIENIRGAMRPAN